MPKKNLFFTEIRNIKKEGTEEYKKVQEKVHLRSAKRMLRVCRANAGIYTKAGQHIASLNHVVPREYSSTMSVLQDKANFEAFPKMKKMMEKEMGRKMGEVFTYFDELPIASASLAQVHRATLFNGDNVAVKLQYPGLYSKFKTDIATIGLIMRA